MSGSEKPSSEPNEASPTPPQSPVSQQPSSAAFVPTPVPGAAGFVYADVPNRVVALIIDALVVVVINLAVAIPLGIFGIRGGMGSPRFDTGQILIGIIGFAISIGYFFYSWTQQRSTFGMRILGMQVGNAFDGRTITTEQAIRRAVALWGPFAAAQFFTGAPVIGSLLGLIAFGWLIYLLYTTAISPTKQGFHDVYANTVVVKAATRVT
jgi:uncharacterized RDD family membrane protein YckC